MNNGSTLTGSLGIQKRSDGTGGDLSVEGMLMINKDGEMVNILSLIEGRLADSFTYTQSKESDLWQIEHTLNTRFPEVKIYVNGNEVHSRILYETATLTHIDICFVSPCQGCAVLTHIV